MNIDKPTMKEPTIPDPPLGAPPLQEVQGDPRGGDGGGGGGRWTRDGTERGSRLGETKRGGSWGPEARTRPDTHVTQQRSQSGR